MHGKIQTVYSAIFFSDNTFSVGRIRPTENVLSEKNIAEYTVCIFPCILFPSAKIKHRNNVIYHKIGYDCICEKEDAVIK